MPRAAATIVPLLPPTPEETALANFRRDQSAASLRDTLDAIARVASSTRTKRGTIKQAKFVASVLALRFSGRGPTETANVLGVSVDRVRKVLLQVRDDASIDHLLDRMDQVILPLAIDNVAKGVMDGDKDYTLEVARGRGIFRTHKSIEAHVKQTTLTLTVQMEYPAHQLADAAPVRPGSIVGAPDMPPIEGEIVKEITPAGETLVLKGATP